MIDQGSFISEYMLTQATLDQENRDMNWHALQNKLDIKCHPNTFANVLRDHGGLTHRQTSHKPPLYQHDKQYRTEFVIWSLGRLAEGDLFVFSDEMYVENGQARGPRKTTMPIGANSNKYASPLPPKSFRYMFWGAFCYGYGCIYHVWEAESKDDRQKSKDKLAEENRQSGYKVQKRRQNARIPGTDEHRILQELNANVRHMDRIDPLPSGRRRQLRRPEWEFKHTEKKRESQRGGIDWYAYRESILWPKLYPYVERIQQETGKKVWLVEDNASLHTKAADDMEEERIKRNINKVRWPAKSPDLNMIESLWNILKNELGEYRIFGTGERAKKTSQHLLVREATEISQDTLNELALKFKRRCEQVKEEGGGNKHHG